MRYWYTFKGKFPTINDFSLRPNEPLTTLYAGFCGVLIEGYFVCTNEYKHRLMFRTVYFLKGYSNIFLLVTCFGNMPCF